MGLVEHAARAAYERAFLKHAPEDVDRWDDLVADNEPSAESWREVARAVIVAVADEVYGDERFAGPFSDPLSVVAWLRSEIDAHDGSDHCPSCQAAHQAKGDPS